MGRPRKPLQHHVITGNYRPSKHGPCPGEPEPPEPLEQTHPLDAEVNKFALTFCCGNDFFGETGLVPPVHVWPPGDRPLAEITYREGLRTAWKRLGKRYLELWKPEGPPPFRQKPWALCKFGEPD